MKAFQYKICNYLIEFWTLVFSKGADYTKHNSDGLKKLMHNFKLLCLLFTLQSNLDFQAYVQLNLFLNGAEAEHH